MWIRMRRRLVVTWHISLVTCPPVKTILSATCLAWRQRPRTFFQILPDLPCIGGVGSTTLVSQINSCGGLSGCTANVTVLWVLWQDVVWGSRCGPVCPSWLLLLITSCVSAVSKFNKAEGSPVMLSSVSFLAGNWLAFDSSSRVDRSRFASMGLLEKKSSFLGTYWLTYLRSIWSLYSWFILFCLFKTDGEQDFVRYSGVSNWLAQSERGIFAALIMLVDHIVLSRIISLLVSAHILEIGLLEAW